MANQFDNQVVGGDDELDFRPLPAQRAPAPRSAAPPATEQPKWGAYAKPGPYVTTLKPEEEKQFQGWVKQNKVPWTDSPTADYDMRGYWKAQQSGDKNAKQAKDPNDNRMHFPDTFKTPYHETFSSESRYALPTAPHWKGDQLVDSVSGQVLFDDEKQHDSGKPKFAEQGQDGIDFRPAAAPGQRSPSPAPRAQSNSGDGLDFRPHTQSPASQPQETISAYTPTLLRRIENVFTEGVPR